MPSSDPSPKQTPGFFHGQDVVRWGIIGCGDVAEVKSGPGFQKANASRLVAVMRRDGALAADFAKRHGVPRSYDRVDVLIADPEVDAVYVATPPDAHLECALKVAAAGKPAYVEKPMARNTAECDAMIAAFERARVPLFVAYYRRRLPRFLVVNELLDRGAIGTITSIHYEQFEPFHQKIGGWRTTPVTSGGGHVLDVGSHTIDLMDYFFGPLREISGSAANIASDYAVEDVAAMSFKTPSGVPGTAHWNFASQARTDLFRVNGTDGKIEFPVFATGPVRLETAKGVELFERDHPLHVHQPLIQSIVDELLGSGTCPSTGISGRRTTRVMDTLLDTYYGGRQDAFWERMESWPGRRR